MATSRPSCVMTTSSPRPTRSKSSANWALASRAPIRLMVSTRSYRASVKPIMNAATSSKWRGPGGHTTRPSQSGVSRPVSRVLYGRLPKQPAWRPFLWDAGCPAPQATYPDGWRGHPPGSPLARCAAPSLFGLAPGGACRAAAVASRAVRSCRTVSPLPPAATQHGRRRSVLCGAVPGVAPAGRYPAPHVLGARTFLPRGLSADARAAARPADTLAMGGSARKSSL